MKYMKIAIISLLLASTIYVPVKAQTADEIIQKHITAIGGADNWKKINTVKMSATSSANGTEIPITLTIQQGKGMKVEFTFSGMTGYTIITDKTGWNYNPFGGSTKAEVIPEEAVTQSQDQLDIQGALVEIGRAHV